MSQQLLSSRPRQVYVAVAGKGPDAWQPVEAKRICDNSYRILEQPYDAENGAWEFAPGSTVICEIVESDHGLILAAVRQEGWPQRDKQAKGVPSSKEFAKSEWVLAEHAVLSSAHEDDYALWEVGGAIYSALDGTWQARALRLAQAMVLDMLKRGLLGLNYGQTLSNEPVKPVPAKQWKSVVADVASWDPFARDESGSYYSISSTPKGLETYHQGNYTYARESDYDLDVDGSQARCKASA